VLWSVVLYGMFPPLVLLVMLLLSPASFRSRANSLVENVLFSRFRVLPCEFIKIVLTVLLFVWLAQLLSVYRHGQVAEIKGVPGAAAGVGAMGMGMAGDVMFQGKGWRSQRNLYLTSLTLVLWWMLYSVHVLSVKLEDALRGHEAKASAPAGASASSSGQAHSGKHD